MQFLSKVCIRATLATVLNCLIVVICFAQASPQITPADIYKNAHLSVVVVFVGDGNSKPIRQGSGFIVAKDRIVTNHHVVEGAKDALVVFADGTSELVEGVAADSPARDLAVLVVKTGSRLPLKLGDEDSARPGDSVYALGAPLGLESSFTNGIVSGRRELDEQFRLQTTALIAPGSSGGPLFDSAGRVIGVTTEFRTDSPGIYFSIGARDVKRLLQTPNLVPTPFSVWSQGNMAEAESAAKSAGENNGDSSAGESVATGKSKGPYVTRVWKNLRDGQSYRTSSNGEVMHLESVDVYPKTASDILDCDFKKAVSAGGGWTGVCLERNQRDRSTNKSSATLTTFSETQIEGGTEYIPEFVMIPANDPSFQRGQLVPGGSTSRGGIHVVTDVMGTTAVLHGAAGSVLGKCQTPCSFNDLVPSPYSVDVQKEGYRSVQMVLRVVAGKIWEQKIGLDELRDDEKMLPAYQEAIRLKPDDATAWNNLGLAYDHLQQYDKAIPAFQAAVRLRPDLSEAWNSLGYAYMQLHQDDQSLNAFNEAVRLKPDDYAAWNNLGLIYDLLHKYENAIPAFQEAIRLKPGMSEPWLGLGVAYDNLHQYEKAPAAYQEAIRQKPDDNVAWRRLGFAYDRLKQYDKAISAYQEAIRLKPGDNEVWKALAVAYDNLQQYDKAVSALKEAIRLEPGDNLAWYGLGDVYDGLHQYDKAIPAFQEAVRLKPDYATAWYKLGIVYNVRGDRSRVKMVYEKLKTLDQNLADDFFRKTAPR